MELRAGEISLHSDLLLHGSEPNLSDRRRCGLTLRYASTDVTPYWDYGDNAIVCRGQDPGGRWVHTPCPPG